MDFFKLNKDIPGLNGVPRIYTDWRVILQYLKSAHSNMIGLHGIRVRCFLFDDPVIKGSLKTFVYN